jgi:hypothetical protein
MHELESLNFIFAQAKQQVEVGAVYHHYRNPNHLYRVLAVAIDEKLEQPCVVYQALYGDYLTWVRSFSDWCGKIEYQGQIVSRFLRHE